MIKSNLPYLLSALQRYHHSLEASNTDDDAMSCDEIIASFEHTDQRWRGVQCAIYFYTSDVNCWHHCNILSPCQSTFDWINQFLT